MEAVRPTLPCPNSGTYTTQYEVAASTAVDMVALYWRLHPRDGEAFRAAVDFLPEFYAMYKSPLTFIS